MADPKLVQQAVGAALAAAGFKRKSDTWRSENEHVVILVNLQKSQYSRQYYVNCGISLKRLGGDPPKREHLCHVRFRLTAIAPDVDRRSIDSIFDLEDETLADEEHRERITSLIRDLALPFLQECSSGEGIAEAIKNGKLDHALVSKQVRDLVC
ncbi:DUF4304 domain-containing protein [Ciceribacter selenitireducens]